tara:strand:- start:296 stop:1042 length:747 start_codon:yes stop_codon:yes gene_type:complete
MRKNYVFTDDKNPNFYDGTYNEWFKMPNFPGHFVSFTSDPPRHPSAVVDLRQYENFESYFSELSENVVRDYKMAENKRYIFEEFCYDNYIPDIHEIHQSTLKRKGKMNPYYLRSIEEMGGYPKEEKPIEPSSCDLHHTKWFGVFRYLKNYKQGDIVTNKKLVAYCALARDGDLSVITFIFGHGDYLKSGIMFYLLVNIVKNVLIIDKRPTCLHYWSMSNLEPREVISWKKRMLFEPACLYSKPITSGE